MKFCGFLSLAEVLILLFFASCVSVPPREEDRGMALFDGSTLSGWEESGFGGMDEVWVEDGAIQLDFGMADLSGITWAGPPLPRMSYEVTLQAMRVDGSDFFCGLTFPVGDSFCSLIIGGWGGGLVGLSSLDGLDASENETGEWMSFENGHWYHIRLRVTKERLEAWIDGNQEVDAVPGERDISIRPEMEPALPFGIAAWNTRAALRNIRIRELD